MHPKKRPKSSAAPAPSHPPASKKLTDTELLLNYLHKKVTNQSFPDTTTVFEFDLYGNTTPWEIWERFKFAPTVNTLKNNEKCLYFITPLRKISSKTVKHRRTIGPGTWKGETAKAEIRDLGGEVIGHKWLFRYGDKEGSIQDNRWLMNEYCLHSSLFEPEPSDDQHYVLCRLKKTEPQGPRKNKKICTVTPKLEQQPQREEEEELRKNKKICTVTPKLEQQPQRGGEEEEEEEEEEIDVSKLQLVLWQETPQPITTCADNSVLIPDEKLLLPVLDNNNNNVIEIIDIEDDEEEEEEANTNINDENNIEDHEDWIKSFSDELLKDVDWIWSTVGTEDDPVLLPNKFFKDEWVRGWKLNV